MINNSIMWHGLWLINLSILGLLSQPDSIIKEFSDNMIEIPIDIQNDQIFVESVWVNGIGPNRFKFDTGAQGDGRIDKQLVKTLNLSSSSSIQAGDTSGRTGPELLMFPIDSIRVGQIEFSHLELIGRDYNSDKLVKARGQIDGMIGIGLFSDYLITIDYANKLIKLSKDNLSKTDDAHVFQMQQGEMVPTIPVTIAGNTFPAYVDTGAMTSIIIPHSEHSDYIFSKPPKVVGHASSVTGEYAISMGQLSGSIYVGDTTIKDPQVFMAEAFDTVILGAPFLSQFEITIDLRNELIRMIKKSKSDEARTEPRRRFGLMLTPPKSQQTSLIIHGVVKGGIAEEQGMKAGDEITAINGHQVTDLKADEITHALQSSAIKFTYLRNEQTHQITLRWDE
ncbi:MAG: aspartyl protease family protein [Marinicella sp.]